MRLQGREPLQSGGVQYRPSRDAGVMPSRAPSARARWDFPLPPQPTIAIRSTGYDPALGLWSGRARLGTLRSVTTAGTWGKPQGWTRGLLRCGLAAGPVFVAVFLVEGTVRDGYRPLRHPVSSLALGSRGWIQAGSSAVAGTLFLAGAAGLARVGDPVSGGRAAPA